MILYYLASQLVLFTAARKCPNVARPQDAVTYTLDNYFRFGLVQPSTTSLPMDQVTLGNVKDALTYTKAKEVCSAKGMELCYSSDLCSNGSPNPLLDIFGATDNWIAVKDKENEWFTYNRAGGRLCKTHTQVANGLPAWGTNPDATGLGFSRAVKCCVSDRFAFAASLVTANLMDKVTPGNVKTALTWAEAKQVCTSKGQDLCHSSNLCYSGAPYPPLDAFGTLDNWIAVKDKENEWLTFNRADSRLCKTHTQVANGLPAWGTNPDASGQGFNRAVKCCVPDRLGYAASLTPSVTMDKVTLGNIKTALTWSEAQQVCTSKGQELCSSSDLCVGNVPLASLDVFGALDNWIAVKDKENEWFTYNRAGDRLCKTHTQVAGVLPAWGTNPDATGLGFSRAVKCCSSTRVGLAALMPTSLVMDKVTPGNINTALTYADAQQFCYAKGQELCKSSDLCLGGNPITAFDTFGTLDNWIAVKDKTNEWFTYNRAGGRLCKTHTQVAGDVPYWGINPDATGLGFSRAVKCCVSDKTVKPLTLDKITPGNIKTALTWAEAKQVCTSKGQDLCHSSTLCVDGSPLADLDTFGALDNWIAVKDKENEWFTYNRAGDRLCKTHTQVAGVLPAWGTNPDATGLGFSRAVKCCSL